MNIKQPYITDYAPEFLYEVPVTSGSKTYTLTRGMQVSVTRRQGLIAGRYEFLYGERAKDGQYLLQVEGPLSRAGRRRRLIRTTDVKQVHVSTRLDRN